MSQNTEIESSDVIRLILQFLKENNLNRSLQILQEESKVALNAVDNVEQFNDDIQHGRWDVIIQTIGTLSLPDETVFLIYEQMVCEMLELQEMDLVSTILRETSAFEALRLKAPERFKRLQRLANKTYCEAKEIYEDIPKEKRRSMIAHKLVNSVASTPPSRLIALIGMALKWQQYQGLTIPGEKFDLLANVPYKGKEKAEMCIRHLSKSIQFGQKSYPECALFTSDGQHLISGSVDGFIEVWNWMNGSLNVELEYQKEDNLMMHEDAVISIAISKDSEILASGSLSGQIKVWRLSTGKCLRKFDKAHDGGITSINFSRDSKMLLTASFDHTARVHGLKSGKTLKTFREHTSYVNIALYSADGSRIITGGSDGRIKIWDSKTTECLSSFTPPPPSYMGTSNAISINTIFPASQTNDQQYLVCTKSPVIYLMNLSGQILKTFSSGKPTGGDFVSACVSPRGEWIYCVGEDCMIYCFSNSTGKLEHIQKIHEKDAIGSYHHPHQNVLATWGFDGCLNIFTP